MVLTVSSDNFESEVMLEIFYIYGAMRSGKTYKLKRMKKNGNSVYMTCNLKTQWNEVKTFIWENQGKDICIDEFQFVNNFYGYDYVEFILGLRDTIEKKTRIYVAFLMFTWRNTLFPVSETLVRTAPLFPVRDIYRIDLDKEYKKEKFEQVLVACYSACSKCGAPGMYHTKTGGDRSTFYEEDKNLYQVRCGRCKVIV